MCAGMCEYRELSSLICVVFIFGHALGYICHSQYQSASELTGALMRILFLLQWICTVNNISRQIYLTDNPEVADMDAICHA